MADAVEASEHASFYTRNNSRARIPVTVQKKILAAYRTAYTTLICIIVISNYKFGGSATYVSPLLAAISGGSAYFGQWQNDAWKVTYAATLGSAIGAAIGFSWHYNYVQIILLFIALTWSNRISLWDRLGKIIAAIGIVLGTLWPTLSDGVIIGLNSFVYVILIVCIPYGITGITLLFPRLSLASYAAEDKVTKICLTLNSAVSALVRGFCAADFADLYTAEVDHLLGQLEKDLDELTLLKGYVESEALVFHKLQLFGPALSIFISTLRSITSEISSVRDNLDCLLHNKTQAKFVELLRPILGNLGADIEIVMCIMNEHLTTAYHIRLYPSVVYQFWSCLGDSTAFVFDHFICRRRHERVTAVVSPSSPSHSNVNLNAADSDYYCDADSGDTSNRNTTSSLRSEGTSGNLSARSPGRASMLSKKSIPQRGLSARTLDTLSDGIRYFEAGSKSIKIKSMLDRRKFYHDTRHPDEEEKLFSSSSPSHCGGCEGFDHSTNIDRNDDIDLERDIESNEVDRDRSRDGGGTERSSHDKEQSSIDDRWEELQETLQRLRISRTEMIDMYRRARAQYVWHSGCSVLNIKGEVISKAEEEAIAASVLAETKLLSLRNLDSVLREKDKEKDNATRSAIQVTYASAYFSFCRRAAVTMYDYMKESLIAILTNILYIITVVVPMLCTVSLSSLMNYDVRASIPVPSPSSSSTSMNIPQPSLSTTVADVDAKIKESDLDWISTHGNEMTLEPMKIARESKKYTPGIYETKIIKVVTSKFYEIRVTYAQPVKIALACTMTSFFILLQQLAAPVPNSLWAILVVILVRQENTSSSFLTGYQRLEGTVVGAVYAFTMFQAFSCSTEKCGFNISTPVLVIWLGFCAFFRDGPRHGYAALVAGFTPIVLFLGNTPSDAKGAWERVELTFIGIGIYLLVDNLILPNRTDVALRAGVLKSIQETRVVTSESLAAVRILMTIGLDQERPKKDKESVAKMDLAILNDKRDMSSIKYRNTFHASNVSVVLQDIDEEIRKRNLNGNSNKSNDSTQENWEMIVDEKKENDIDIDIDVHIDIDIDIDNGTEVGEDSKDLSSLVGNLDERENKKVDFDFKIIPPDLIDEMALAGMKGDTETSSDSSYEINDFEDYREIFTTKIGVCGVHLKAFAISVGNLKGLIVKDTLNLSLVVHEPEIWRRTFPGDVYKPLLNSFSDVMKGTSSVASATKSFSAVLQDMVNRGEWSQVITHFSTYAFMTKHLVAVISKIELALNHACQPAISRTASEILSDLTALVTLNRGCEALQQAVDDHYRQVYSTQDLDFLAKLNPYFLVSFQDVFHSVTAVTKNLSALGIAMMAVRDVEALSAL